MTFKFTPEHFYSFGDKKEAIAYLANNLLEAEIATLPKVLYSENDKIWEEWPRHAAAAERHIKAARLWDVREKKCEHQRLTVGLTGPATSGEYEQLIFCRDCGKRLVATWTECEE